MFPDSTIVCLGGGPSLTVEDVESVRGRMPAIAISDSYKLAPWADVLYSCDAKWWNWHQGVPRFAGPKYSLDEKSARWPGVQVLKDTGVAGLELDPSGLRTGRNSGYQAINLAVHLGARRVLLLGYDMSVSKDGRSHWFGDHPDKQVSPYVRMLSAFDAIVQPLAAAGVTVINCSRRTALKVFPCAPLEQEIARSHVGLVPA